MDFLKDPVIVNSVFLKKPKLIEVLWLILLTSLLIWRLMERSMCQYVAQAGEKLPGWDRKPTDRPTSFMMTTKFTGIMVIKIGNERRLSKPTSFGPRGLLAGAGDQFFVAYQSAVRLEEHEDSKKTWMKK